MFTGLIEDVGELVQRRSQGHSARLVIRTTLPCETIDIGDSIAVNGACLTVDGIDAASGRLSFYCLNETLSRTNLAAAGPGAPLNLERALRLGDRLGGHLVAGHVDTTAKVLGIQRREGDIEVRIDAPADLRELLILKGSIAVNGISLTIADLGKASFSVRVIPHTWDATNLRAAAKGIAVNLEGDMVGKFILRRQTLRDEGSGPVTWGALQQAGFSE